MGGKAEELEFRHLPLAFSHGVLPGATSGQNRLDMSSMPDHTIPSLAAILHYLPGAVSVCNIVTTRGSGIRIDFLSQDVKLPNMVVLILEAGELYVDQIFTSPQKQGLGTVILNGVCDFAVSRGYSIVSCTPELPAGEALARTFGFKRTLNSRRWSLRVPITK